MPTQIEISDEDRITVLSIVGSPNDYLMWQLDPNEQDQIYFEYNKQANGGYNIAKEITISLDGIHILLTSDQLVHFYFDGLSKSTYEKIVQVLQQIYARQKSVVEVLD